ncbi:cobalamin biosynthesis protein [Larsenimonas salina]|uniref:cobalamin biosynthesis protein n=1 Tax=Larsenimonas salina TaxID=1295565 RepID=UPI0020737501|nr:cobalamin biosynthesis protein [Larsenimonas salina]MCM5703652.1 cobalamin biosynthesis protein [Larsenimonas salina]
MITIVTLTEPGRALGERLLEQLDQGGRHVHKPAPFGEWLRGAFLDAQTTRAPLICVCATGIVVRTLSPILGDKYRDPPVLVLDERGQFVIPLLSGHEGGANDWAERLAGILGAQNVTTTARRYVTPRYTLGMGCERGCEVDHLEALVRSCLNARGLAQGDIHAIASIDLKADEVGLIELASRWQVPFRTFTAAQLFEFDDALTQRSEIVYREVGVYGVAEAAALASAHALTGATDDACELILPKQKTRRATCAIARSYGD